MSDVWTDPWKSIRGLLEKTNGFFVFSKPSSERKNISAREVRKIIDSTKLQEGRGFIASSEEGHDLESTISGGYLP